MATKMGEQPNSLTRIRLFTTSNNKWSSYSDFLREVCQEITNTRDISLLFHFAGITEVRRMITMMLVVVVFVVKFTRVRSLPGFVSDFQTPVWYCWWRCQLKSCLSGGNVLRIDRMYWFTGGSLFWPATCPHQRHHRDQVNGHHHHHRTIQIITIIISSPLHQQMIVNLLQMCILSSYDAVHWGNLDKTREEVLFNEAHLYLALAI